jgi:predicted nuclease with RNAse H fold/nitroimidazol reductase NimA-like FMN-containing flavoprotein (pyridoxamine 5'-phosphate oxidase superfamily)
MTTVCGIDVGSLRTPADVAWLDRDRFVFGRYVPSAEQPLPEPPSGMPLAACYALDAPQSLPAPGSTRRVADREARTPTSVLPDRRAAVAEMRAYGPFVEAGLTIFWTCHQRSLPVVETYPRFVIRTLWPELAIPSKRREPKRYVAELWARIRLHGYTSRPPGTHDEIDAMLCALAAEAVVAGTQLEVGAPLVVDEHDGVLREGYIVSPRPSGPSPRRADELAGLQAASLARADRALRSSWPAERTMDAEELGAFLYERRYCVLATTTSRGRAQARPVGFTVFADAFWLATVAGGRLRNLEREPWASLVVSEGEGDSHRAVAVDGAVTIHERPPDELLALWEHRFGSRAEWASAWLELRPRRLFSYSSLRS